jgi:hypothetical protein
MAKQSISDENEIYMEFGEILNDENGNAEFCIIGVGEKTVQDEIVPHPKPQFTIYNLLDHEHIRVMIQNCNTSKGPSMVDFIVRLHEGVIEYDYSIIVEPAMDNEPTLIMPFQYILGYIGGALKAFSEFSNHEHLNPEGENNDT